MGRTSHARESLMDAAYNLICEYSYGAVTIDAICERAHVKKGSFYYFFESKSDLAIVTINSWWEGRSGKLAEFFDKEIPPLDRLRNYLNFVTKLQLKTYETSGQLLGCPLFTLGAEICTQDAQIRDRIRQALTSVLFIFTEAIADAQALGEIEGTNPEEKARMLLSLYEGILTLARIENNPAFIHTMTVDALAAIGVGRVQQLEHQSVLF